MKCIPLLFLATFFFTQADAQIVIKEKKYPSLLWEITGKGMKKPSYLIGTMHVSSKLAFNLPDSFYMAIRSADVVALENNPETWQEEMNKYETNPVEYGMYNRNYGSEENDGDYLTIATLKYFKYESKIERALFSNPPAINSLLYRTYGEESSDFEEDTYLDMYIFQTGRKLGKKTCGVEQYGESMRLMMEAYKDAAKDKNKKQRSYSDYSQEYSMDKLQEAYRKGDLDLLDSIHKFNSTSDAFDEKFLYKRNEIQANSMDSIMRSGSTLFVGVGAAHLPGNRGVIEMLRKMGYKLRPVKWGQRNSSEKDIVDKIRVPVIFKTTTTDDGMYKVDIPGQFYQAQEAQAAENQWHFADMANGSYYMVTRIPTHAWLWNHNEDKVMKKVDSLLYENIPGKILSKTTIVRNGYKGFDITNRTRRGDMQRYNIFVTPYEVLLFKMSGNGDYVKNGTEAGKFFNSIQLKEFKNNQSEWKTYSPSFGGFTASMPHDPYVLKEDGNWHFDALDQASGTYLRVIRTDIHNYGFAGEDTFDLTLMEESFLASEFMDTIVSRRQAVYKGYPVLDTRYKDKDGQMYKVRFLIRGPHYYTLVAHAPKETAVMDKFIQSFAITPFTYGTAVAKTDTNLRFTVTTPYYPESKKIKFDISLADMYRDEDADEDYGYDRIYSLYSNEEDREKVIANDSTGERIYIKFSKTPPYMYIKDSARIADDRAYLFGDDTTMVVRMHKKNTLPNGLYVREVILGDTASSRTLHYKFFSKDGIGFMLTAEGDTLSTPSAFTQKFFETFQPADTLKGVSPYTKKNKLFFDNLASSDSVTRKKALQYIPLIDLDSTDFPALKMAVETLSWKEKNYLKIKGALLARMDDIGTDESARYLQKIYTAAGDTVELQHTILEALLQHKTALAYTIFKDIVVSEPPVLNFESGRGNPVYPSMTVIRSTYTGGYAYDNESFFDELHDSLQLTRTILPDLLPLLNLDDYKENMMQLLGRMADSNLVTAKDYEPYYSKFLMEAKQAMRKQEIAEKAKAIEEAEEKKKQKKETPYTRYGMDEDGDAGNDDISLYTRLLLPFAEKYPAVNGLVAQVWQSRDKKLKYNTMLQLMDKKMTYPDTLVGYFAALEEYRYILYSDLKERKKANLFPAVYNNHIDLAKSMLLINRSYGKPDSLVYLDRLPLEYEKKKGFIYFFKYKEDKEAETWKLAVAGMTPEQPDQFQFEDSTEAEWKRIMYSSASYQRYSVLSLYDFTELTGEKLLADKPVADQLRKILKKMLYSRKPSATRFYTVDQEGSLMDMYYKSGIKF